MKKRCLLRKVISETICHEKKTKVLTEMDIMSTVQEIIPTIIYLINAGYITYNVGKLIIKKYQQGKITEDQINALIKEYRPELSLQYFKDSAWQDKTDVAGFQEDETEKIEVEPSHISFNDEYFFNPDDTTTTSDSTDLPDTFKL